MIQDCRKQLIRLLEKGEGQDLIEMYMSGCARDRGKDVGEFTPEEVLNALRERSGEREKTLVQILWNSIIR